MSKLESSFSRLTRQFRGGFGTRSTAELLQDVAMVTLVLLVCWFLSRSIGGNNGISIVFALIIPVAALAVGVFILAPTTCFWLIIGVRASVEPILGYPQFERLSIVINLAMLVLGARSLVKLREFKGVGVVLLPWLVFLLCLFHALSNAADPLDASRVMMVFLTYTCVFCVSMTAINSERDFKLGLTFIALSSIIPGILGILDTASGGQNFDNMLAVDLADVTEESSSSALVEDEGMRIMGGFSHPNIAAFYLVSVVATLTYIWTDYRWSWSRTRRYVFAAYTLLQMALLMLTQTRGAWFGLIAVFLGIALFVNRKLLKYLAVAPFLLALIPSVQQRVLDMFTSKTDIEEGLNSYAWRVELWKSAFPLIKEKFFGGWGIDSFPRMSTSFFSLEPFRSFDAHNVYVQMAFEGGIFMALGYASIFLGLIWYAVKHWKSNRLAATMIAALALAYMMASYSDNMHRYLVANWYYFSLFGILVGYLRSGSSPSAGPSHLVSSDRVPQGYR